MEFLEFIKMGAALWIGWVLIPVVLFVVIAILSGLAFGVAWVLCWIEERGRKDAGE